MNKSISQRQPIMFIKDVQYVSDKTVIICHFFDEQVEEKMYLIL